jgi:ribosome-associated toxin RatA of RatAB toxin-antitoxin module
VPDRSARPAPLRAPAALASGAPRPGARLVAAALALLLGAASPGAEAQPPDRLDRMLARGPVVVVERDPSGALRRVVATALIDAPAEEVWELLTRVKEYPDWLDDVRAVEVVEVRGEQLEVEVLLRVPGPDLSYRAELQLDRSSWSIRGRATSRNLAGSAWDWILEPQGDRTLVHRRSYSTALTDHWLLKQFPDQLHVLHLGINATTPLIELEALRRAVGGASP